MICLSNNYLMINEFIIVNNIFNEYIIDNDKFIEYITDNDKFDDGVIYSLIN
jgi:hypothetical protein